MYVCSGSLFFGELADEQTGIISYRLLKAHFCRVRYCPICQWRRSLFWRARFYQVLPSILDDNPTARFIFLTLTVKNCDIFDLRDTLKMMSRAWGKFIKRKEFSSVIGWVRTTEVTRGKDNSAHPHFHCLLMVHSSYFSGRLYVKKDEWAKSWKSCMNVDYIPVVDVRAIKHKKKYVDVNTNENKTLLPKSALFETLKYSVKIKDMTANPEWFIAMTEQTHRLRFIATGGLFKDILKKEETITDEEMIHLGDDNPKLDFVRAVMCFLWRDDAMRYFLERTLSPDEAKL